MSRKRRSLLNDLWDEMPLGALFIILIAAGSYVKKYWYVFAAIAAVAITIVVLVKVKKKKKKKAFAVDVIDAMDGIDFEEYTAEILRHIGYKNVRVTKASGDFGVDVTAKLNNEVWVFQCKRYAGKLGVKSVQEVFAGAAKYHADKAVVVTNSYFTDAAIELAEDTNVILWDREYLSRLIKSMNKNVKSQNLLRKK